MRAVLEAAPAITTPGAIVDLPFQWPDADWERDVLRTYEEEAHIVHYNRSHGEFDAEGRHWAKQVAAEAANYCADCAI